MNQPTAEEPGLEGATKERERAYAAFQTILTAHSAAIGSLKLVASLPEAEQLIAAQMKAQGGWKVDVALDDLAPLADRVISIAGEELDREFETLRRITLVSLCGALEYLIKAVLVDLASFEPLRAAAIVAPSKVKLSASEVLGLGSGEQWLLVADRLFESLAESQPLMYQRAVKFLSDYGHLPLGEEQLPQVRNLLTGDDVRHFNEAYLVRNCLVHNGGRVSSALARFARFQRGEVLRVDRKYGVPLIKSVRTFAEQVNSIWMIL